MYLPRDLPALTRVLALVCLLVSGLKAAGFPNLQITNAAGPITRVSVGQDGALQIEHLQFPGIGQIYPKMCWPADCGFFLRHNGRVVGMDYANHEGTAFKTQAAPFYPISQTQSADGQLVRTVMNNSTDGTGIPLVVTQSVSYCPGDSWILVSVDVNNESASAQTVDLFAAADIYLADSDSGYPFLNTNSPQVAVGGANSSSNLNLFIQAAPGSPQPAAYQEDFYATIWNVIGNGQHFQNTIGTDYQDNGVGLEWRDVTIPAGSSFNFSYYWAFGALTCVGAPVILTSPQTQTAEAEATVDLRVQASGASPLSYCWYVNDTNLISYGTNCGLTLSSVQLSQSGAYKVMVSNACGVATSSPAILQVIPPVERRSVPGIKLMGEAGSLLNLDYTAALSNTPNWVPFDTVSLGSTSQYYFDLTLPLPAQGYYRAWQAGTPGTILSLEVQPVPAITLTGSIGNSVRVDYINRFGPIDAEVTLDTVVLTNTSQLYFDTSAWRQPERLYRLVPLP